jgi:hypothetical protein
VVSGADDLREGKAKGERRKGGAGRVDSCVGLGHGIDVIWDDGMDRYGRASPREWISCYHHAIIML